MIRPFVQGATRFSFSVQRPKRKPARANVQEQDRWHRYTYPNLNASSVRPDRFVSHSRPHFVSRRYENKLVSNDDILGRQNLLGGQVRLAWIAGFAGSLGSTSHTSPRPFGWPSIGLPRRYDTMRILPEFLDVPFAPAYAAIGEADVDCAGSSVG